MAEVIGTIASALTIAALFKTCIEAFDLIRASQRQEADLRKLSLRLNIEKCRLYTWGEAMGLTRPRGEGNPRPLESHQFQDIVKEALDTIIDLFHDSQKIKNKYGCREADLGQILLSERDESSTLKHLAASFGNFKVRLLAADRPKKIVQRSLWVIHDCDKFHGLIREVKDLIDGVQDITKGLSSIARQDHLIKTHVMKINDEETLDMVSDVCEIDHPTIADAATARADTISMATTKRLDIIDWTTAIDIEQSDGVDDLDVESLTITELKNIIRSGFKRNMAGADGGDSVRRSTDTASSTPRTSGPLPKTSMPAGAIITVSTPPPGNQFEQDLQQCEVMVQEMATAGLDQDFRDELSAIESWFDVLSKPERTTVIYALFHHTTRIERRFFTFVLDQMAENDASLDVLYQVKDASDTPISKLEAAMAKLNRGNSSGFAAQRPAGSEPASELDPSTINAMFPDAVTAIAKKKAEYAEAVGNKRL